MKSQINLYVIFSFNYPHNFIQLVWGSGSLADHLQSKFNGYYQDYGARGVFNTFYAELDGGNRAKLEQWILDNYKG